MLVVSVVTYISWISWYTHKYKNMENTYIRCIMENVINQYPDLDMEEIAIILNKSYSELESSTTSEEFDSILRKNGITDNTFYIKDMSDIRNVNIIVSTSIIGVMSVLFIICFCMYLRRRKKDIFELQDYMDKISRGNYELEINDNSEDELSSLKNSLYKIMVYMKEQADSARIKKVMLAQSVSDISHQLKTPLTSTQVLLDNLNDNPDMDYSTRKKFIYEALNQVNGMSWMIVSMLKLSRIDAGVVEFNNENISINKIIEEAVGNLEVIAEIKNVNIEKNIDNRNEDELNKSDIYIKGDYNWNREALQNIIKNAIEHSNDKGTVKINITDNDVYTAVYITNRGEKLSDKQQKQIFERYYSEAKYEDNSMGIGLPLAKAVIEKQGGYISVESDDEETVFIVKYINKCHRNVILLVYIEICNKATHIYNLYLRQKERQYMEILKVEHLVKQYGKGDNAVLAVNDISFSVEQGEFVAIVGSSGSGKSTLLHLLGGVDRPTSGKVYIQGEDIYSLNSDKIAIFRRRQVGLIYQSITLYQFLMLKKILLYLVSLMAGHQTKANLMSLSTLLV